MMKVLGTVKDAATEEPLQGAKVRLYIREKELAVLYSDSEGKFEHKEAAQYIGEILKCKVEKEGYEPDEVVREFEADEVPLEIKLDPVEEGRIELKLSLGDEKRNPLEGVNITLEVDGEEVGVGLSDKYGFFKISLGPDLKDKTINYKAELGGFELASGKIPLKKETSPEITMKKLPPPPPDRKWLKIAVGAAGIAAAILVAIIISQIIPSPEMPVINSFEASPSAISAGEGSTLSWSVSDATSVIIDPEIGSVALTGTRAVYPTETTTYWLTATNDAGNVDATVEVIVEEEEINLPVINFFTVSEISVLSWSVSGATSVTIEPGIGDVALTGTSQVSPTKTTTYTLTATNNAGSVKDTVIVEVLPTPPVITWDFETGDLSGWTKTGTAFDYQPTYGDNPTERRRGQPSKHQGDYWIGSYEKYPGPDSGSGYLPGTVQGDKPQGTLTSSPFTINTNNNEISFLIGGGNHPWPTDPTCVNLEINGKMVKTATGKNTETMERVTWDVSSKYNGQEAVIKLYDMNSESWGHINFDDVKFG